MNTEKLKKYIAGDVSQEEKEEVQLWLEADEKNRKEFMSLRTLYDITLGHLAEPDNRRILPRKKKSRAAWMEILKIAAVILITIGCSYYFLIPVGQSVDKEEITASQQTLYIPAGQRAELTLTDGTKVWLNAQTTFTFPDRFSDNSREVFLDGEGYFDVNSDSERVFTVNTSMHKVNVLGTEFNIRAYEKDGYFETSLLNGSVEVETKDNSQSVLLTPGHSAYWENDRLISRAITHYDHFLWRTGIISFDDERVEDILAQLQLYYDIEIRNENLAINNMRYTGKFRTKDGIEHVLNVLRIPTKLRYVKDNEKNIIFIH